MQRKSYKTNEDVHCTALNCNGNISVLSEEDGGNDSNGRRGVN